VPGSSLRLVTSEGSFLQTKPSSDWELHYASKTVPYLPVEKYPINFICLREPIHCEKGYVVYKFTSDLFLHFRTPQPEKAPTNLIAISEFHAHCKAAHLVSEEATLHQQVLEDNYALPPLCTWDNEWSLLHMEMWKNVTWGEGWKWFTSLVSWNRKGRI
jgi:hypothetical protein